MCTQGWQSLLTEQFLSHPFHVLRRQYQVNHTSECLFVRPYSIIVPVFKLQCHQSIGTFWKGSSSRMTLKGVKGAATSMGNEYIANSDYNYISSIFLNLLSKTAILVALTPFYAASLVETVQSEIASEPPHMFDFLHEGLRRFTVDMTSTRMFTFAGIVGPTILFGLLHDIIHSLAVYSIESIHNKNRKRRNAYSEFLMLSFTGNLLADVLLFPLELVVNRLYLQGSRTIIDDLDNGTGVIPIFTNYAGFTDCIATIRRDDGILGFYRGFGVLLLQYSVHLLVVRIIDKMLYPRNEDEDIDS